MAVNFLTSLISNILSLFVLVLLPVFAGILIFAPFFPNSTIKIRRYAKGFCIFHLIYSILFLLFLNPKGASFGFIEKLPFDIIPSFSPAVPGVTISFGLDNLSALMCVFTSFVVLFSIVLSKSAITGKQRLFYSMMLILEGLLIGIFAANDLFTFFIFFNLEMIPAYFLISMWGGAKAKKSALKYVLYGFFGAVLMLISTALIYAFAFDSNIATDFESLINRTIEIPLLVQLLAVIGFTVAFAVKLPIFPFHTWLSDAHTEAPTPASMVLAGVSIKTAAYGLIRTDIQMFYEMFQIIAPALIFLGAIGILWGSYLAMSQNDIKKMVANSSVAQMGIVTAGLASLTEYGLNGAIFHSIAHGLVIAGLFAGTEIIYLKFKTRKLELLGGISKYAPKLCALMIILCAAYMAIPLTIGFPGLLMSFMGAFNTPLADKTFFLTNLIQPALIFGALGIILTAAYVLRLLHRTFFGLLEYKYGNLDDRKSQNADMAQAKTNEFAEGNVQLANHQSIVLTVLAAAVIIFGLYPMGILDKISTFSALTIDTILTNIF